MSKKTKKEMEPWGKLVSLNKKVPSLTLSQRSTSIGRAGTNHLQIQDAKISKKHCVITFRKKKKKENEEGPEEYTIKLTDTSVNGVYVNSQLLGTKKSIELKHGYEITFLKPRQQGRSIPKYRFFFHDLKLVKPVRGESDLANKYEICWDLDEGGYGKVVLATHKETQETVAIKSIPKGKFYDPKQEGWQSQKVKYVNEINVLKDLRHPNIIELKEVFDTEDELFLVMEYVDGGDLFYRISDKERYEEDEARELFKNLLETLKFLHDKGYVHRDLKPDNILLASKESDTDIKLCDFGFARLVPESGQISTKVGTINYRAPETLTQGTFGKECDLWSCGVILYILVSGTMPFHNQKDIPIHKQILTATFDFPEELFDETSLAVKNLIRRLIQVDIKKRITTDQALEHPWITGNPEKISDEMEGIEKD
ncbi:serine/threonine-protein kinase fhke-related [Anaeramoeba flamelloides]|uniref:Serine/threonine-protein kinase fhke-related n=1 Tax=Anaeramoeba flamelloides TaxID=1746091 RepID=A0AAV8A2Z4_9EUKA|nr:serine/threonine-protein kinase fhke-related [Anaeramoeba flamelloides]KAJ6245705.1 serine/threonine-protein kinase fhke-related [Anaeramoeba flamelloides]